jgi:hypothetical protein
MKKLRYGLIAMALLVCSATTATAGISIGIGVPNLTIGINLPVFPELVRVPGYPVYYAPRMDANYFFYDGMYWVYLDDNWYASLWYNGPWSIVGPDYVPRYILRIPVRYYRRPPVYFRGWQATAPPHWGQHWGHDWERRRSGWNRWNRAAVPAPAPLPAYQRNYTGDRYPRRIEQQRALRDQHYRYQPHDRMVRQHFNQQGQRAPAPAQRGRQEVPTVKSPRQQEPRRPVSPHQRGPAAPHAQPPHQGGENLRKSTPGKPPVPQRVPGMQEQRHQPGAAPHQQAPGMNGREQRQQDRGAAQEPSRDRGQGQRRDEERGR